MKISKKLTVKEFGNLNVARLRAKTEEADKAGVEFFVGRIYGSVRAQEVVDTPHGTALKFKGEFRGVGFDGEEVVSMVCYLPTPGDEMLSNILNDVQGAEGAGKVNVEFAFDFYTAVDKGVTGYKYVTKPLLEVKASNPIAALGASLPVLQLQKLGGEQLALEHAPEESEAPQGEPPVKATKGSKK